MNPRSKMFCTGHSRGLCNFCRTLLRSPSSNTRAPGISHYWMRVAAHAVCLRDVSFLREDRSPLGRSVPCPQRSSIFPTIFRKKVPVFALSGPPASHLSAVRVRSCENALAGLFSCFRTLSDVFEPIMATIFLRRMEKTSLWHF